MASLAQSGDLLAIISGSSVAVYNIGSPSCNVYKSENLMSQQSEDSQKQKGSEESGSDRVLVGKFSPRGTYFVACDDYKQITVWRTGDTWQRLSTRPVVRRGTALTFTQTEDVVLMADKSGNVYSFSLSSPEETGKLLLGHVSMLLDVMFLADGQLLATCDRDEKIRISCYPNTHTIHSFCLGHTDFVSALTYFHEDELLVSGSGDGTVRVWDYRTGVQRSCTDCRDVLGIPTPPSDQTEDSSIPDESHVNVRHMASHHQQHLLLVTFDGLKDLLVFKIARDGSALSLSQKLTLDAIVWDIVLEETGRLWVLTPDKSQPLQVYKLEDQKFVPMESSDTLGVAMTTAEAVNQNPDFFTDSHSVESPFTILRKARIDNMEEYVERKKQRIKEKSQTSEPGTESVGEPELKKTKTDETQ